MKKASSIYKDYFKENYLFESEPFIGEGNKYYVIYKILFPDGKYYIGEHVTKSLKDGYAGSGHLLPEKYKKTDIISVKKYICFLFQTRKRCKKKRGTL